MAFTVTIETMVSEYAEGVQSEVIVSEEFETKKEANAFKRSMIKAHNMTNHARHTVNYSKGLELFTNY